MGVANDHSIAWGIAQTLGRRRARRSPSPIRARRSASASSRSPNRSAPTLVLPCDVEDIASVDAVFADARGEMGLARLPGARDRVLRQERAQGPLRRHLARELHPHDGDLLLLLHRGGQARRRADAGGRRDGDAHLQWRRARHAELQRHGRGQGGAGSVGALSRGRFRAVSASASTRSRPARSARSRAPASATRARCSRSSSGTRRCGAA